MAKLDVREQSWGACYGFRCPGCNDTHVVQVRTDGQPSWGFDGNLDAPTFTPSILVRSGHYAPGHQGGECWCTYNANHSDGPAPFTCAVCHSFVRGGRIEFLADCTHELAGRTVDLPDYQ
jgi:hypothetical protein